MPKKRHLPDEADIGSGEKTPGQIDTEKMIEKVKEEPTPKRHQGQPPCPTPFGPGVNKPDQ